MCQHATYAAQQIGAYLIALVEGPAVRRTGFCGISVEADHSGLMLAARTTLAHFSVSSAMNLPNSAGDIGIGTPPRSASRFLIVGSARPALIASLSLSTISVGVFLGAPMPNQALAS